MDEAAFAVLVGRTRPALVRHAAGIVGDADAEDVVQVALVRSWTYDAPLTSPAAFLHRVVHRTALNAVVALHAHPTEPLDDWHGAGRDVAEVAIARAEAKALLDALARLPAAERELVLRPPRARYGAGEATSGGERQRLWRVRERLRGLPLT